jgi:hypothetical protein
MPARFALVDASRPQSKVNAQLHAILAERCG